MSVDGRASDATPTTWPVLRLEQLIDRSAARHPDKVALICGERRWTYGEMLAELDRRAARLIELGLRPGAIMLTVEPLDDDFLLTFLAGCRARAIMLRLGSRLAPPELLALAERAAPRLVLTATGAPHPTLPDLPAAPLALPGTPGVEAAAEAQRRSREGGVDEAAMIRQTSSTTRRLPKLALRGHRELNARDQPARRFWWQTPEDVFCLLTPDQFYAVDTCQVFGLGATLVQLTDISPRAVEATLLTHGVTVLSTVPAALHPLGKATWPPPEGLRLRAICTTSSRLPRDLQRAIEGRYGVPIAQKFASTEAGVILATTRHGNPDGSIGKPIVDVEVRLVDDAGADVPEGAIGELVVRAHGVMLGYLGEPEETAATLRDGWIWTGDLARRDDAGYYYWTGRRANAINVGGSKVSPEEVEQVLEEHPGVAEAVVVGASDEARGEIVRAIIVPRDAPPDLTGLIHFCRERLAAYKVPRLIEFRDSLPRSAAMKVLRREL